MTKEDALTQALEALERSVATCFDQYAHRQVMSQPDHFINKAIFALRKALAQPEQDAQPERPWAGLTIEDKKEYIAQDFGGCRTDAMDWAEKRLMEKNT